ncbi:MAG: hypothetical protein PVI73_14590, partial [Syntrophobacterales bacterium]
MKLHLTAPGYVRILIFLLLSGWLLQGCMTPDKDNSAVDSGSITTHLDKVKEDLDPLTFQAPVPFSESTQEYFRYYGLEV